MVYVVRPYIAEQNKIRFIYFVIPCSDGTGRTGTYILIDMVLNRMAKGTVCRQYNSYSKHWNFPSHTSDLLGITVFIGVKEIDIAATLEHIRDQRPSMVRTKVHKSLQSCCKFILYMNVK